MYSKGKGKVAKHDIGKGVSCYGGVDTNENPNETSGFKTNDSAVDMYGGVSGGDANENKYESKI